MERARRQPGSAFRGRSSAFIECFVVVLTMIYEFLKVEAKSVFDIFKP
jgi:hypothetical protein